MLRWYHQQCYLHSLWLYSKYFQNVQKYIRGLPTNSMSFQRLMIQCTNGMNGTVLSYSLLVALHMSWEISFQHTRFLLLSISYCVFSQLLAQKMQTTSKTYNVVFWVETSCSFIEQYNQFKGSKLLQNTGINLQDYTVLEPRKPQSEQSSLWKPQNLLTKGPRKMNTHFNRD
jgi:hypothetical protein